MRVQPPSGGATLGRIGLRRNRYPLASQRAIKQSPFATPQGKCMIERRWNAHVIWFVFVIAGGVASFYAGSHAMGYALTQIAWQNHRGEDFADVKASVRLLSRNDLTTYHAYSRAQLRDSITHLAMQDDDWRCSDNQGRILARARTWFKDNPDRDPAYAPLQSLVETGLHACDRP